ncbi:MAG: TRAP transporter TatT component family protein [Fidelibacterota bacterium]
MNYEIKSAVTDNRKHSYSFVVTSYLILFLSACSPALILEYQPELVENVLETRVRHRLKQVRKQPQNRVLLQKACTDLVKFGYGFQMEKADRLILQDYTKGRVIYKEAQEIFKQAIDYGEQALMLKYPQYRNWLSDTSIVLKFSQVDVPLLYWTAAAYAGTISASRGDLEWVILLPRVGLLLSEAMKLDPGWNKGSLYSAMITYTVSQPNPPQNAEKIARDYFHQAIQASKGQDAGSYVALAESVAKKNQNKDEFRNLLTTALAIDINADSELRLNNVIAQKRAQWLLDNIDEFFY